MEDGSALRLRINKVKRKGVKFNILTVDRKHVGRI